MAIAVSVFSRAIVGESQLFVQSAGNDIYYAGQVHHPDVRNGRGIPPNGVYYKFVRGHLVVKLPAPRVDELVAGGHGDRFDANKGTPMKEWFSLDPGSALPWPPLAREALDFAKASVSG